MASRICASHYSDGDLANNTVQSMSVVIGQFPHLAFLSENAALSGRREVYCIQLS